ncbi:MAG: DUF4230 domain-containing protein [Candidatus Azobacteroides sp.]|nr:DUF4230 domain-containing protein [Candidatus Azobacteroides sp.]
MTRNFLKIVSGILIGIAITLFLTGKFKSTSSPEETITNHQEIVEKIEAIGKLELVRLNLRDVMEHQLVRQWLPNATAVLIIHGEATGCIDLEKLKSEDIFISKDSISLRLPAPEICYIKVDHEKSKVYETSNTFLSASKLIDSAYAEAEKQLRKTALNTGILEQTKTNGITFFQPFLSSLGFNHTYIYFDDIGGKRE